MKLALLLSILGVASLSFANTLPVKLDSATLCDSTKEFVSTLEYLRDRKELAIEEQNAQKIAEKVSNGCKGSFNRFEKVTQILTRVGIDSSTAVSHAIIFANSTDERAMAFIEIFKKNYSEDKLDLDALTSLKISLELAESFDGTSKNLLADFNKLVEFCKDDDNLGLPLAYCAELSAEVTKLGAKFSKPISEKYIELVRFLSDKKVGPQVDKKTALAMGKEVAEYGPTASENFITAYKYAVSKKGLGQGASDAISFAKKMAQKSYKLKSEN